MHQSAVIGWGILFAVIAYCAFVVDRDRNGRERKLPLKLPPDELPADSPPEEFPTGLSSEEFPAELSSEQRPTELPLAKLQAKLPPEKLEAELLPEKRRRSRFPWGVLAGSVLLVSAIGGASLLNNTLPSGIVPFVFHFVLLVLLMLGTTWYFQGPRLREATLGRKTKHLARSLGFGLRHLMVFLTILGVTAGIVRARYPEESLGDLAARTIIFTGVISLLAAVAYLGVDTLFFGRGSGRRANRLHEIEKRREDEEFSQSFRRAPVFFGGE